jgi:hypothetical protein
MAGELNEALSAIGNLGNSLKSATRQYKESVDDLRNLHANTNAGKSRRADAEKKAEIDLTKKNADALNELYQEVIKTKAEYKRGGVVSKESTANLQRMANDVKRLKIKDTGAVFDKALDKMTTHTKITTADLKKYGEIVSKQTHRQEKNIQSKINEFQSTNKVQKGLDKLTDSARSAARTFFSIEAGITNITAGFARSFDELEFAQQHQIGMYSMMSDGFTSMAYSMSLAPEEMQKFVVANKALIVSSAQGYENLSGAIKQSVNILTTANTQGQTLQDEAYKLTGNYGNASLLLGSTMAMLKKSGENLSFEELKDQSFGLLAQFKGLSQISGKSSEQIASLTSNFLENDTIRQKMNAMQSNKERQLFVKNTLASVERNRKLGFSLEQAFKIAESMAGLSQIKTKDRIKQSAVTAQLAGALGLSKEAKTVEHLGRKKYRNADENTEFQLAMGRIGKEVALKMGGKGAEAESFNLYFDRMSDNMGSFVDLLKVSNTTSVEGNSLSDVQTTALKSLDTNLSGLPKIMQSVKQTWDNVARALIKDPVTQIVGGAAGILGNAIGPALGVYFASGGTFTAMMATATGALTTTGTTLLGIGSTTVASVTASTIALSLGAATAGGAIGYAIGTAGVKFTQQLDEWFGTNMWGSVIDSVGSAVAEVGSWFSDDIAHQQRLTAQMQAMAKMTEKEKVNFMAGQKLEDLAKEKGISKEELNTLLVEKAKTEGNNMADIVRLVTADIKNPNVTKAASLTTKNEALLQTRETASISTKGKTNIQTPDNLFNTKNPMVAMLQKEMEKNNLLLSEQLSAQLLQNENSIIMNKGLVKMDKTIGTTGQNNVNALKEQTEIQDETNRLEGLGKLKAFSV